MPARLMQVKNVSASSVADLRPDVRARHARHAVLHRLPAPDGPALRVVGGGDRFGEGRGALGAWPGRPHRPRSRRAAAEAGRRGLDPVDPRGNTRRPTSSARSLRSPRRTTPTSTSRSSTTPRRARCSSTSSTSRRCATSSCPRSSAPGRWPSPSPQPARPPRWPSASSARSPRPTGPRATRLAELLNDARGWAKGNLPTYQDRKAFFEGIVNGEPDPIALLRAGDEDGVRALIDAARHAAVPA